MSAIGQIEDKKIVVTGGAGFIGSNLANELASDNEVHVIDNCFLGSEENVSDGCTFWNMDVRSPDVAAPLNDVDLVFHLAALSSYAMHESSQGEDGSANRYEGAGVNVLGFINVVEKAMEQGCDTVVYATTSSIYGSRTEPSPESMDVHVNTGYEASKMARENYAEYFSNHYDMNMCGLRYFSVYQGFEGNEGHKGEFGNVISQFVDDMANGNRPVLYGDGEQTRDFTHVSDIVNGTILAAENKLDGVYNLGTGEAHSFNYLVERINAHLGTMLAPEYVENPIPDDVYVHDTCADFTRINEETGWEPQIDFEFGVKEVVKQYRALDDL